MTDLMRSDLRDLFRQTHTAHAGLLIQRGLTKWEDGDKPTKKALVQKISHVQADDLYLLAFKRWLAHSYETSENTHFASISAKVDGRLMTGLPLGGTLETGVTTHHTYGMPMIAGSSVKGAVRSYAEFLFAKRKDGEIEYSIIKDAKGNEIKTYQFDNDKQAILDVLFGSDDDENPNAGYLIWHDAWWIPPVTSDAKLSMGEQNKPFAEEVVTVHHQAYYSGKLDDALDIENPIPNQQLAVQGGFYFVIEGVYAWVQYAKKLLEQTLQQQGVGAKSGAGYGYFVIDEKLTEQHRDTIQKSKDDLLDAELTDEERTINDFVKHLNGLTIAWKGKPNQSCGFNEFYEKIIQWEDKAMLKKAYEILTEQGEIWQGKALSKSKAWKPKLQSLREKFE
ncbi:type III-B CRISPR module RAMP protein Cmr6 [Faucicola atlantae]|nr:type III-B CRISPR module RAMP protein Cmr6 [Moraxella atlantae]